MCDSRITLSTLVSPLRTYKIQPGCKAVVADLPATSQTCETAGGGTGRHLSQIRSDKPVVTSQPEAVHAIPQSWVFVAVWLVARGDSLANASLCVPWEGLLQRNTGCEESYIVGWDLTSHWFSSTSGLVGVVAAIPS